MVIRFKTAQHLMKFVSDHHEKLNQVSKWMNFSWDSEYCILRAGCFVGYKQVLTDQDANIKVSQMVNGIFDYLSKEENGLLLIDKFSVHTSQNR